MVKNKLIVIFLAILLVVSMVGAVWYLMNQQNQKAAVVQAASNAVVEITPHGFVPETVIIKVGQTVEWVNSDDKQHQVSSDPHPLHTSLPELSKTSPIQPHENMSFQFTKKGEYSYHDETDPVQKKGVIIVQ